MGLVGTVYGPSIPKTPPYGGNHVQNGDEKQGGNIGDGKTQPGISLIKEGQYGQGKAQELAPAIAHKYFCMRNGQIEHQEPSDSRRQAEAEKHDRTGTGKGSENDRIGQGDNDRNTPGKAVNPVDKIDSIGNPHNPQKGKGEPEPSKKPEFIFKKIIVEKTKMLECIRGNDNQEARNALDKKFSLGREGMKVIQNTAYQGDTHAAEHRNKPDAQINLRPDKDKKQRNNNKHYRKTNSPKTRDISGMNLSLVNGVIPCILMGYTTYPPYSHE
jgi:hypothetical protein